MEPTNEIQTKQAPQTAEPTSTPAPTLPMVRPGQRALLLSHREYTRVREIGQGLGDHDLLMREPEEVDLEPGETREQRWLPVRADKYLKHRAIGWREADSLSQLPAPHRVEAKRRGAFVGAKRAPRSNRRREG